MKFGWIITSVLHGGILLAALIGFGTVTPLDLDNVAPVEVEIVSIAPVEQVGKKQTEDLTTKKADKQPLKKIVEKPKPRPTPKADKPKPKADKPKPVAKAEPQPTIEKLIEDNVKPAPTEKFIEVASAPKPMKRPNIPKPKPEDKPKVEPKPLDDNKISALLNKLDANPLEEIDLDFGDAEAGTLDSDLLENVEVASLSQFEFNAVKARMIQCWSIPAGAQDAGDVVVRIGFKLNQAAQVIGQPTVLNNSSHPSFRVMAESAIRAILECGPYDMLPPEKYDVWNEFTMEFDPRSMFNG